jgi:hypothetical protein
VRHNIYRNLQFKFIYGKESRHFPDIFYFGICVFLFLWKDKKRRNLVAETHHDRFAAKYYERLRQMGITVSREGIPWPPLPTLSPVALPLIAGPRPNTW